MNWGALASKPLLLPFAVLCMITSLAVGLWGMFQDFILNNYYAISIVHFFLIVVFFCLTLEEFRRGFKSITPLVWILVIAIFVFSFYLRHAMFSYQNIWDIFAVRAQGVFLFEKVDIFSILPNYSVLMGVFLQFIPYSSVFAENFSLILNSLTCIVVFLAIFVMTKNQKSSLFGCFLAAIATQTIIISPIIPAHASFFFISFTTLIYLLFLEKRDMKLACLLFLSLTFTMGIEIENAFLLFPVFIGLFLYREKIGIKNMSVPIIIFLLSFTPLMVWYGNYDNIFQCDGSSCAPAATEKFPTINNKEGFLGTFYLDAFHFKFPRVLMGVMAFPHFFNDLSFVRFGEALLIVENTAMNNIFLFFVFLVLVGFYYAERKHACFFGIWIGILIIIESFAWQHSYVFDESAVAFYPALIMISALGLEKLIRVINKTEKLKNYPESVFWFAISMVVLFAAFSPYNIINPQHEDRGFPYNDIQKIPNNLQNGSCVLLADVNYRVFFGCRDVFYYDFSHESLRGCSKIYYFDYPTDDAKMKDSHKRIRERIERYFTLIPSYKEGLVTVYVLEEKQDV